MAIQDDFSIATSGDIRHISGTTRYTVIDFHRYLGDLMDNAQASGDDLLDITSATASERSTDNIITLNAPYNIDDDAAEWLYDGSITQDDGDTSYRGLVIVGSVVAGTELQIIQNDGLLRNYWGTGINADAAANILMRLMVKTRVNGVDKDQNRLRVQARELGDTYGEFAVTMGLGNNTAAVFTAGDLNNTTLEATIDGWDTITNTEGLRKLDVNNNLTDEDYYSEWNRDTFTINQLYERAKWIQKRPSDTDTATETGTDYPITTATRTAQGQEFLARDQDEKLTSCTFSLKEGGGTPTGTLIAQLYLSDDVATAAPTGAVLATSEPVLVENLTASYQTIEFVFNDSVTLTANEWYFIVITNAAGDATNFVHVEGDTADGASHPGNKATEDAGWTGTSTEDLTFSVRSAPIIHDMSGPLFRGPTLSLGYDTEAGTPTLATNEELGWGTLIQVSGVTGTFIPGEAVHEDTATPAWKGEVLSYDLADLSLLIIKESGTITGTDTFTGQESGATATADSFTAPVGSATGGGLMKLLAFEDDGTDGELYIQLLRGANPVDNEPLYITLDTADSLPGHEQSVLVSNAKLAITPRTVSAVFLGSSTGSALIGAYGIGVELADLTSADLLTDLTGTPNQPPNNVTFVVSGLEVGDRILVGPEDGAGGYDQDQLTLLTTLNAAGQTAIVCTTAIPVDTPATGQVRVQLDTGIYRLVSYTSYTSATFTTASTDWSGANAATNPKNVAVSYIDKAAAAITEQFTTIYNADRTLFVRVREGTTASPIKTFESTGNLTNTGGTATAIRTPDA